MLKLLPKKAKSVQQPGAALPVDADKPENQAHGESESQSAENRSREERAVRGTAMKFRFGNGDKPLSGFTIKRGVGVGGFGEVYFATNDAGKEVALKQIQRNLDVEVRGVRQCMNLKHPNLISLYDIQFDADNQGWIVMEYVSGMSLRDTLEQNPEGLERNELNRWFGQIVAGVAYLHDHGIVHRDLKPANIFQDEGIVKIGDYGLSKFISCSRRGGQTESVGTFHYMAPEIGKGEYGKEIDVYALGVMLFELVTGTVPYDGESSQEIIMKHLTADPDLQGVASPIREVVGKALAKNPSHRFSDVRDMLRPLGLDVDEHYMLVRTAPAALSADPKSPSAEPAAMREPPAIHEPMPQFAAESPAGFNAEPSKPRAARAAKPRDPVYASAAYDEPILRNLRSGWGGLNRWWAELPITGGFKALVLAVAVVIAALNAPTIASIVFVALLFYLPYYIVWWLLRKPAPPQPVAFTSNTRGRSPADAARRQQQPGHAGAQLNPGYPEPVPVHVRPVEPKPVPKPAPKKGPISARQWKVAKRMQLANISRGQVAADVTGSWMGAAAVLGVLGTLATIFFFGSGLQSQGVVNGMVWVGAVALMVAWVSIALGKRWQGSDGDWAVRSFIQLTAGFAVGLVAYLLADVLMVSWDAIPGADRRTLDIAGRRWDGFFENGAPLLPAYLAYFPLLMGLVGWWKQADPLRRTRFSFFTVVWAAIAASLVHLLIAFPQQWAVMVAVGASVAVQLASSWINPTERLIADRKAA